MIRHPASACSAIPDDQRRRDVIRRPPDLSRNHLRQPLLSAQRPKHLAHVDDLGLDLDDQEGAAGMMPGEDVHESTLASMVERHLGPSFPPEPAQCPNHGLDERGVLGSREPMKIAVARPRREVHADPEHLRYPTDRADRQRIELATLQPGDRHRRDDRQSSDIHLSEAAANAHRAEDRSDPVVEHDRMVRTGAYLPVASGTNGTNVRYDGRSGAQCGRPGRGLRTTG
ncbi:MAG: hypothetical protein QOI92_2375 [Chloroflexota bacterium]|nr:hypothetical protein [Chloroflexota bacterium]